MTGWGLRDPVQFVLDFLAPAAPLSEPTDPPSGSGFTHPAANRHAQLQGRRVSYRFERSRRRTIGLLVGPEGLVVRAPRWVPLQEVDAFVQEKSVWIVTRLQEMRERARQPGREPQVWAEGAQVPYLGRMLTVRLGQGPAAGVCDGDDLLRLQLPPEAGATQVREAAQAWLQKQARLLFVQRLDHFAPLLGVQWRRLSLSGARTRWGSAGADGHIRLNWRLVHLPPGQIDYVVVHELAHLREMNHSPRFWDTVGGVMPDYRERRQALRQSALTEGGAENL